MTSLDQAPAKRRRCLRFSLRTLLVAVTLLCIWLAMQVNAARRQREAVAAIQQLHGRVVFDYQIAPESVGRRFTYVANPSLPGPAWLRKLFGDDCFREVVGVQLSSLEPVNQGHVVTHTELANIAKLPKLRWLALIGVRRNFKVADFEILGRLRRLEFLSLNGGIIDDAGLTSLLNLEHLRILEITFAGLGDEGMEQISKSTSLESLLLEGNRLTDAGAIQIGRLSTLISLKLSEYYLTDAALQCVKPLTNLKSLDLSNTRFGDAGIQHLKELKQLTVLDLQRTRVTPEGIRELQQSLPSTKITGP